MYHNSVNVIIQFINNSPVKYIYIYICLIATWCKGFKMHLTGFWVIFKGKEPQILMIPMPPY